MSNGSELTHYPNHLVSNAPHFYGELLSFSRLISSPESKGSAFATSALPFHAGTKAKGNISVIGWGLILL